MVLSEKFIKTQKPDWKRIKTGDLYFRNLHYDYHGVFGQIATLDANWLLGAFTDNAKKNSALMLLKLWQLNKGDSAADEYLNKITEITLKCEKEKQFNCVIDVDDLPIVGDDGVVYTKQSEKENENNKKDIKEKEER